MGTMVYYMPALRLYHGTGIQPPPSVHVHVTTQRLELPCVINVSMHIYICMYRTC